ncbi:hypothetical protein CEP54_015717 [Fusarium duplospermum]|uniref:Uncharacterized protein n=1 Tax=Fusarium duplospermum TaxID=1325734 RepID=A0A428NLW6_9HYPO|nr:hypothetical protein CEP54_015717 [Fusarium duplospermum]
MSEFNDYPKRPVLIDIESGFSLSGGCFKVTKGNVVRANGSRLRALFNPTSLRLREDQEKAEKAAEVLSNKVDIHTIYVEVERVPGLVLISGGSGKNQVLCVGWDRFAVGKLARNFGETNQKDEEHQRDNGCENDTDFQPYATAPGQNFANAPQPLNLEWLFGSYVIQFEGISEDWHRKDFFTLDIGELNDDVLMAAYDFGDVWGTMILSQSEEKLDLWAMLNDNPRKSLAKARQRLPTRYETTPSSPRRLFYQIRGRQRGEDVIFFDPESGHIDILDHECTKLSGVAETLADMGSNLQFWGHKVADEPNKHIQAWGEFSEKAYEFERRDRWRRR